MYKLAHHALQFYKLLRKEEMFQWMLKCDMAFTKLNRLLCQPLVFVFSREGEILHLHLFVFYEALWLVYVWKDTSSQKSVNFIGEVLQGPKIRYKKVEKVSLILVITSRKIRNNFLAHPIVVRMDYPIRKILFKPYLEEKITKWVIDLSEFDIS